jgi:uncharacterized 2Fe-2S/4Fe-4S cluster protein (DUF4445 family)
MTKIYLREENKIISCAKGSNLYALLARQRLLDAPCGGRGICGKCKVMIDGETALACHYTVNHDISVKIPEKSPACEIVSGGYLKDFVRDNFEKGTWGIALDIGTTTLVATLVELSAGRKVASLSCLNAQKSYGQDVISRIHFTAEKTEGLHILQQSVLGDIRHLLRELCRQNGIPSGQVSRIAVAGNTTMIHLLLGVDPISMARAPYQPVFTQAVKLTAGELNLPVAEDGLVYCLPAVSSYVGGDITAGIIACGLAAMKDRVLFIDIGTNGELLLSDGGKMVCCSCAAGPALEGMNISCGMLAAHGAIDDVTIEHNQVTYSTIGGAAAQGICGSGILAAVAQMRRAGILHDSGRLLEHPLVQTINGKKCFVIDAPNHIYLTQQDIRQVQLAKGAILSGIYSLLEATQIESKAVDRIIVAGQFGAHLQAENLIGSGLLPAQWLHKITYAGNTAQAGAYICLLSEAQCREAENTAAAVSYLELSTLSGYEALYIQCLNFS